MWIYFCQFPQIKVTIKAFFSFAHLAKSYNHNNEVMCSFHFKLLVYDRSTRRDNTILS